MNSYLEDFIYHKFKKPGTALDLGAGQFRDISHLEHLGWVCEGVDKLTNIDLEDLYISKKAPFDLVYSNYVLQKIKNKDIFLKTMYENVKSGGWIFIHTFDKSDKIIQSGIDKNELCDKVRSRGFVDIEVCVFNFYDNEPQHRHWHKLIQVTAKKV